MTSNRMYVGPRYEPQGRNANLPNNMFKRTPIFTHIQADKQDNSPFSNYKTNESFTSETTQDEKVSPETLRCLIKEEVAKLASPEDHNRKLIHTLQAQITDLKERISEYERDNSIKLQETVLAVKEELRFQAERMDKEVEQEITSKLRSFFQKVNYELKKDILKTIEDDFLTITYGEDLENRLDDINLHIESLNTLVNSKDSVSAKLPSDQLQHKVEQSVLSENIELKLTRIDKEIEHNKKHTTELGHKLKQLEDDLKQENKRVQKDSSVKVEHLKDRVKLLDQDLQKRIGGIEIQISSNEGDKAIFKDRISELQKYNEEQRHLFLDFNKKLSNSRSNDSDPNELSTSILVNSSTLPMRPNGQAVPSELPVQSKEEVPLEQKAVQKTVGKKVYQFDTENHLMDGDGNYILTEQGQPIKLSEQQIQALIESNTIEVQ